MASRVLATIISLRDQFTAPAQKIAGSTRNINREIRRTQNQIRQFGADIKKTALEATKNIANIGAATAGIGVSFAVKEGLSQAMDLEGARLTLETVMKDAKKAREMLTWGTDFANATPFENKEITEGIVKLQAYGLAAKKVLPAVGDMAAVMGKSLDQGVEAIADAQTGELERLKEFGISKDMIIKQAQKLRMGLIVNNKGQITDQKKFNQALFNLMEERFKGGMQKQAGTMKGILSTITGVTKSALATVVGITKDGSIRQGSIYESLKLKIQSVGDVLTKWQNDGTIDRIASQVTKAVSKIIEILKIVWKTANDVYKFFKDNWSLIAPIIMGIVGAMAAYKVVMFLSAIYTTAFALASGGAALATGALKAVLVLAEAAQWGYMIAMESGSIIAGIMAGAQWALNAAMSANPIGLVVTAIALLATGLIIAYNKCEPFRNAVNNSWEAIKNFWGSINKAWTALQNNPLGQVVIDVLKLLNPFTAVLKIANDISNVFKGIFGGKKETTLSISKNETTKTAKKTTATMKKYALGGIATKPSIFGEAGPEIAIPLKNTARSQNLLNQANNYINGNTNTKNQTTVINTTSKQSKETKIDLIIQGDVYGFSDFKEKIAQAIVEIVKIDGANVAVRGA